ncbi:MAG: DUF2007 domain-containing protein [Chloroflexota bacterium]|nr:DUF2007 domain-containing protein [Chloroflexota bacterium]
MKDKHVCPNCGYDYEPWVEVCPDCERPLIWRAEEQRKPEYGVGAQWVIAGNAPNAILASFIKSQLEAEGIPVLIMRSSAVDIAQFSHNDYVAQDIRVPSDRLADARSIMDAVPDIPSAGTFSQETTSSSTSLPEGWTLLPTGVSPYRQGGYREESESEPETGAEPSIEYENEEDYIRPDEYATLNYSGRGGYDPYGSGSWKRRDWIRIIYGILLATMSLPFLFQVLQQFGSIFGRHP